MTSDAASGKYISFCFYEDYLCPFVRKDTLLKQLFVGDLSDERLERSSQRDKENHTGTCIIDSSTSYAGHLLCPDQRYARNHSTIS